MMQTVQRLTEQVKAAPANLREAFGGVAAPSIICLTAIIFLFALAVAFRKFRPRRRVGYALVPDPKFDPSHEEIVRWSAGLAEARAAVGFGTNSHRMVRLTFCSDDQGNLVSLIGLNPRARSVAERNGYGRVDLVDPAELLGELAPSWLPPLPAEPAAAEAPVSSLANPTVEPAPPLVTAASSSEGEQSRWASVL